MYDTHYRKFLKEFELLELTEISINMLIHLPLHKKNAHYCQLYSKMLKLLHHIKTLMFICRVNSGEKVWVEVMCELIQNKKNNL